MVNDSIVLYLQKAVILIIFLLIFATVCIFAYLLLNRLVSVFDRKFNKEEIVKKRPRIIVIIAAISFLGIFCIQYLFSQDKLLLFGILFSGLSLKISVVIIAGLSFYIAIGFLKLLKSSWYAGLSLYIMYVISHVLNIFADRSSIVQLTRLNLTVNNDQFISIFVGTNIVGLLITLVFVFCIYSNKAIFH